MSMTVAQVGRSTFRLKHDVDTSGGYACLASGIRDKEQARRVLTEAYFTSYKCVGATRAESRIIGMMLYNACPFK